MKENRPKKSTDLSQSKPKVSTDIACFLEGEIKRSDWGRKRHKTHRVLEKETFEEEKSARRPPSHLQIPIRSEIGGEEISRKRREGGKTHAGGPNQKFTMPLDQGKGRGGKRLTTYERASDGT